ncbi:MAG TPA: hypothetical protein VK601_15430, partial [Kofleriaceae bacterium]|nr:hypothetical protein [Kofleriaceae bacterium]
CLAVWAAHGGAAHADPAAPQVSPSHDRREDAQRLREQLRRLEREPAAAVTAPAGATAPPIVEQPRNPGLARAGQILLGSAALTGLIAIALYATAPSDPADDSGPLEIARPVLAATTVLVGIGGIAVLVAGHPVQVAPTVTPRVVGLSFTGRL